MGDEATEGDLSGELERLGQNLKAAAKAAWESEESLKIQAELKVGLRALEAGLAQTAREAASSEAGQRLKAEVDDLGQRVKSGQVEQQLRKDLLSALRTVNSELQKFTRPKNEATPPGDEA